MVSKTWNESEKHTHAHGSACFLFYDCLQYSINLFMNASGPNLHLPTISQSVCLLFYLQMGGQKKHVTCNCQIHFLSIVILELHKNNRDIVLWKLR
jgi:hypothetical protein